MKALPEKIFVTWHADAAEGPDAKPTLRVSETLDVPALDEHIVGIYQLVSTQRVEVTIGLKAV